MFPFHKMGNLASEKQTKIQLKTINLRHCQNKGLGNKPHKLCGYTPELRSEVYCFRLNFNTSKLNYLQSAHCSPSVFSKVLAGKIGSLLELAKINAYLHARKCLQSPFDTPRVLPCLSYAGTCRWVLGLAVLNRVYNYTRLCPKHGQKPSQTGYGITSLETLTGHYKAIKNVQECYCCPYPFSTLQCYSKHALTQQIIPVLPCAGLGFQRVFFCPKKGQGWVVQSLIKLIQGQREF